MTKLLKNKGYFLQGLIYFKTIGEFAFTISYTKLMSTGSSAFNA
jgi:hypothetical protein